MYKHLYYIIFSLLLLGCVKPIDIEVGSSEELLVIEGVLTNELKRHEIRMTETRAISSEETSPVTGADVSVKSNSGTIIQYVETSPGVYKTEGEFQGQVGESYQLIITESNGEEYVSSSIEMSSPPPIDNIYARYEELLDESTNDMSEGIQFFLDTKASLTDSRFFRFEYKETFEVRIPNPSSVIYKGPGVNDCDGENRFETRANNGVCYETKVSNDLNIATSTFTTSLDLLEHPIRFISLEKDFLNIRYSILAKQYSLDEQTYNYYRRVLENNESTGSLIDKQKGRILGNIESTSDKNKVVLGNFEVSSVSELRKFFSPSDFESSFELGISRFRFCFLEIREFPYAGEEECGDFVDNVMRMNPGFSILDAPSSEVVPSTMRIAPSQCAVCLPPISSTRPDFWISP